MTESYLERAVAQLEAVNRRKTVDLELARYERTAWQFAALVLILGAVIMDGHHDPTAQGVRWFVTTILIVPPVIWTALSRRRLDRAR